MTSDVISQYSDPETILDELCPDQARVCVEFTQTTNKEVFERVVRLVNDIADAGRRNNRDTLEQAVYKIALLTQAQSPNCNRETKRQYSLVWTHEAFMFRGFYVSKAGHARRMARMKRIANAQATIRKPAV